LIKYYRSANVIKNEYEVEILLEGRVEFHE